MVDYTGRMIGQYEIRSMLGVSGVSKVYQAWQSSQHRDVAIKILPQEFLGDQTFMERFDREVNIVANLNHPHIVPIYDFGVIDDNPYLVTAYYKGHTLERHIPQFLVGMPLIDASTIITQIASALTFAHGEGIIHRNVKPSNILLDLDGNAYLFDFGIAKIVEASAELTGDKVLGSPLYMAPEMGSPGGVTPLVDIYALGITLFEMLTGRPPYNANHAIGILLAHVKQPVPKIGDLRPDLPVAIQSVIDKVLAKNPAQRYQTAVEFADALKFVVDRDEDSTDYHTPPMGRRKPGREEQELYLRSAIPIDARPEDGPSEDESPVTEPPLGTKPDPQIAAEMKQNGDESALPDEESDSAQKTRLGTPAAQPEPPDQPSTIPHPDKLPTEPPTLTSPQKLPSQPQEKPDREIPRRVARWVWLVLAAGIMLGFLLVAVIAIAFFSGLI
ncbi:MAG: protein kinase [Anaerolineae bacterium]|nr:protein kinase [Anaerolineae bacterium]